jgi:hypothetical protein
MARCTPIAPGAGSKSACDYRVREGQGARRPGVSSSHRHGKLQRQVRRTSTEFFFSSTPVWLANRLAEPSLMSLPACKQQEAQRSDGGKIQEREMVSLQRRVGAHIERSSLTARARSIVKARMAGRSRSARVVILRG